MKRFAIIVAGGQGVRMGGDLPKQFIKLRGKPILMHTLERFILCDMIVLVLPKAHQDYWQELCREYNFGLKHKIVDGGETRYHSVQSALRALEVQGFAPQDLVAIHDGVRPFVSQELLETCFDLAAEHQASLPYLEMSDSLRQLSLDGVSRAVDRRYFVRVQTPQVFGLSQLISAYKLPYQEHFTDDASVWEYAGFSEPKLTKSNPENIKITTQLDLRLAELLL